MDRSTGYVICAVIVALTAIYAAVRGDAAFAAPMFLVAVFFARWAHREWKRENA